MRRGRLTCSSRQACWDEASWVATHSYAVPSIDMAMAERAEAHGRAARLMADVHTSRAGSPSTLPPPRRTTGGWSSNYGRLAARHGRGAPESATAYLRRALAEPPSSETHISSCWNSAYPSSVPASRDGTSILRTQESARDDTIRIAATLLLANALGFDQRVAEAI
jgi:hypothetical protein